MTGPDLRARRNALGLSQPQLAVALSTTKNTVARWERGEQGIPGMLDLALKHLEAAMVRPLDHNQYTTGQLIAYRERLITEGYAIRPHSDADREMIDGYNTGTSGATVCPNGRGTYDDHDWRLEIYEIYRLPQRNFAEIQLLICNACGNGWQI